MSSFSTLGVPARLSTLLARHGIETPTPIQSATLPDSLAGRDVLGRGRTGSGKTYAFLLPLVARLTDGPRPRRGAPRALILAPTRELVGQIEAALAPLARESGLTSRTVFGGVGLPDLDPRAGNGPAAGVGDGALDPARLTPRAAGDVAAEPDVR